MLGGMAATGEVVVVDGECGRWRRRRRRRAGEDAVGRRDEVRKGGKSQSLSSRGSLFLRCIACALPWGIRKGKLKLSRSDSYIHSSHGFSLVQNSSRVKFCSCVLPHHSPCTHQHSSITRCVSTTPVPQNVGFANKQPPELVRYYIYI